MKDTSPHDYITEANFSVHSNNFIDLQHKRNQMGEKADIIFDYII